MVTLTLKWFPAHYAWFSHGRSHIVVCAHGVLTMPLRVWELSVVNLRYVFPLGFWGRSSFSRLTTLEQITCLIWEILCLSICVLATYVCCFIYYANSQLSWHFPIGLSNNTKFNETSHFEQLINQGATGIKAAREPSVVLWVCMHCLT